MECVFCERVRTLLAPGSNRDRHLKERTTRIVRVVSGDNGSLSQCVTREHEGKVS